MSNNTPDKRGSQPTLANLKTLDTILTDANAFLTDHLNPVGKTLPPDGVIGGKEFVSHLSPEALEETRRWTQNYMKKMKEYPKDISHEGSTVLCVLLSMNKSAVLEMNKMPDDDQQIIRSVLPAKYNTASEFHVSFDEDYDFILKFYMGDEKVGYTLTLFNTIIHPQTLVGEDIPIEADDDAIRIAGQEFPNKEKLQRLAGVPITKSKRVNDDPPHRQPVAGRNAFELRCDLVSMAMELLFHNNKNNEISPEKVVASANILYRFVENKR